MAAQNRPGGIFAVCAVHLNGRLEPFFALPGSRYPLLNSGKAAFVSKSPYVSLTEPCWPPQDGITLVLPIRTVWHPLCDHSFTRGAYGKKPTQYKRAPL